MSPLWKTVVFERDRRSPMVLSNPFLSNKLAYLTFVFEKQKLLPLTRRIFVIICQTVGGP